MAQTRNAFGPESPPEPPVLTKVEQEELDARRRGDRGFGPMVRALRCEAGARSGAFATYIGATTVALSDIERGKTRAGVETVRRIAVGLKADFVTFFDIWDREGPSTSDRTTVAEAAAMLLRLRNVGVDCPCCGRLAKAQRRSLSPVMVKFVAWLVESYRGEALDVRPWTAKCMVKSGGDYAKVALWDFAERTPGQAPLWSPTEKGVRFARGQIKVSKIAVVWRKSVVAWDGALVDITQAGGTIVRPSRDGKRVSLPGMESE